MSPSITLLASIAACYTLELPVSHPLYASVYPLSGSRYGEGLLTLLIFHPEVLYFALRVWKLKGTSIYRTLIPKKIFCYRRGSGTKKTWNAQCTSAHVAMAARASFISIWIPLREGTGLAGSPTNSVSWLVCILLSILGGEQKRREETMAMYFLKPLFSRMVDL